MEHMHHIQQLIDSGFRLTAIESRDTERVIALFKLLSLKTGKAVYHWAPDQGMYRLGAEHVTIPQTTRPRGVLEFIASTIHCGVYLLNEFSAALQDDRDAELLKKITSVHEKVSHQIVLLGKNVPLPRTLQPLAVRVKHAMRLAS